MAFLTLIILNALIWVMFGILILLFVGSLILEIFLSRMKNSWAGLILPGIPFSFSLILFIIGIPYDLSAVLYVFCHINIPTAIYLLIYFFFRRRKKKSKLAMQTKTEVDKKIE